MNFITNIKARTASLVLHIHTHTDFRIWLLIYRYYSSFVSIADDLPVVGPLIEIHNNLSVSQNRQFSKQLKGMVQQQTQDVHFIEVAYILSIIKVN